MAVETKVTCDLTGKELTYEDVKHMCTVNIVNNNVQKITVPDPDDNTKVIEKKGVISIDRYAFHICNEHGNDFIKHVNKFFQDFKKKKKIGK